MGYHRAGFEVVGVDINPQPHYPFEFIQHDALALEMDFMRSFDAIHASPPCQAHSIASKIHGVRHASLVAKARDMLQSTALPYAIENVVGAPLISPLMLCGTMFGLKVYRHRLFECSWLVLHPMHSPHRDKGLSENNQISKNGFVTVAGHFGNIQYARQAMGIDWMNQKELAQAIPPAYTEFIGRQLIDYLDAPRCRP